MRFITSFEIDLNGSGTEAHNNLIAYYKGKYANHLGGNIVDQFGWNKTEYRFKDEHKVEIEAFPIDKWVELKEHLFMHLKRDALDIDYVRLLFKTLESFGKEAGIPNNPPIEQTGVKYFLDTRENKVYKQTPDGEMTDLTNPHIKE